ncbi:THP3 [Mytilus coruscus]|uniref:THP3 n=1 Tax=Mytilus coruscus TaxID=42192 RepID=A0A6J8BKB6_MYTCO|nr:THP3 [Mytilus coruscus]
MTGLKQEEAWEGLVHIDRTLERQVPEETRPDDVFDSRSKQPVNSEKAAVAAQGEWPPSLRDYVQRAFSSVSDTDEKDKMETVLKELLTDVFSTGKAWSTDWSREPLPLGKKDSSSPPKYSDMFQRKGSWENKRGSPWENKRGRGRGVRKSSNFQAGSKSLYSKDRVPTYRSRSYSSDSSSSRSSYSKYSYPSSRSRSRSGSRSKSPRRRDDRRLNRRRRRDSSESSAISKRLESKSTPVKKIDSQEVVETEEVGVEEIHQEKVEEIQTKNHQLKLEEENNSKGKEKTKYFLKRKMIQKKKPD